MSELKHLFQPIRVGKMEVKNRLVMPAMGAGMTFDEEGYVTPQMIAYFVERAKARPGMMMTGAWGITPVVGETRFRARPFDDKYMDSVKGLVDAVHIYDTKFGIQLQQWGAQGPGMELLSPSGVPALTRLGRPDGVLKEMSTEEVEKLIKTFARAAEQCMKAGVDFIEVQGAHGYLINQFLSPYFNKRKDRYGGIFENRVRFLLEILHEIRNKIGQKIAVGVKLNGDDFIKQTGGWTPADACRLAPLLEKEGADYLTISAGIYGSSRLTIPPMYENQGCYTYLCEEVKKLVSIPVAAVGRIKNPVMADRLIKEGKTDLVCMGRAQIADPETVEKARQGQIADIRPCLGDCRGCYDEVQRTTNRGEPPSASCVVNARVGRESAGPDIEGEKKANPRKVLVVGAGCSGLEAARRAAFAGHKVTLCESRGWIGGQLRLAAMMPGRQEMGDIVTWYERQLNKLGVEVRLNTTADIELLDQIKPDVAVLATGSLPKVPLGYIEGLDNVKNLEIVTADELLENKLITGENILVIGGDQIGLQVADYLSEDGAKVFVVEASHHFAEKLAANDRWYLVGRTIEKGVKRIKNVSKIEILPGDEVWIVSDRNREKLPGIDTLVLANERQSNRSLVEVVERKGIEAHVIGDAASVSGEYGGTLLRNIAQGYDVGRQI